MDNREKIEKNPIDLTNILEGYEDKWIVISKDYKNILKSSNHFEDLKEFLNQGIVMLVPNPNYSISPYII